MAYQYQGVIVSYSFSSRSGTIRTAFGPMNFFSQNALPNYYPAEGDRVRFELSYSLEHSEFIRVLDPDSRLQLLSRDDLMPNSDCG